ncbi:GlxA family transcriptional regulator [Pseudomonas gingeri]|uniref:GlxA family transcriptional regulator n=1 Tax=Pseudomonas gingeri TaxID=117681 RepID=UPI0015A49047|nr:helix-turn-helix domain-containing protein [Pseudomonas gingeri]NWA11576.1 helix-turn-helix domain-containing protein [Pseudomonas gingeri]
MHDFTLLVLPGSYASSVAATLDILGAAVAVAPRLKAARPTWRIVSPDGKSVALSGGLSLETTTLPDSAADDQSTWIIPGLGLESSEDIDARMASADAQQAIQAIRAHGAHGGSFAASCTGVFLLQAAQLLAGRRATTSWWLAGELRRLESRCVVDADRMVCTDGPVTTAGAAFAQTDLMLHLLRSRFGAPLADEVSRLLLIDGRQAQSPFIVPMMLSNGNDLVTRLTQRIESALPDLPSVVELADELAMSTRTLSRHVQAATGKSTLALLQSVRLNRARQLIESSRMTIEQVAAHVGYEDATALRRLMLRVFGANPSQFRASRPKAPPTPTDDGYGKASPAPA